LLPIHTSHFLLLRTALMLAVVVVGAYVLARVLRRYVLPANNEQQRACVDGVAALLLAVIVLGLMAAIHTAWDEPLTLLLTLLVATIVNVGLQLIGLAINRLLSADIPIVMGVMTGNRAVAIFLAALPLSVYQPYLLFIACYQIPMYLTPLLGGYFYKRLKKRLPET